MKKLKKIVKNILLNMKYTFPQVIKKEETKKMTNKIYLMFPLFQLFITNNTIIQEIFGLLVKKKEMKKI